MKSDIHGYVHKEIEKPNMEWVRWSWSGGPLGGEFGVCLCVHRRKIESFYAHSNCKNCLGYGIMPIPWSEVNK